MSDRGDYLEICVAHHDDVIQPQLSGSTLGLQFLGQRHDVVRDFVNFLTSPVQTMGCIRRTDTGAESNTDCLPMHHGKYMHEDNSLKIPYKANDQHVHKTTVNHVSQSSPCNDQPVRKDTVNQDTESSHCKSTSLSLNDSDVDLQGEDSEITQHPNDFTDVKNGEQNMHHKVSKHGKYTCEKCGREFQFEAQLKVHRNRAVACVGKDMLRWGESHAANEIVLYKDTVTGEAMKTTPLEAFNKSVAINSDNGYICLICGALLKLKLSLRKHIFCRHSKNKPFKCEHCTKSFKLEERLKDHKLCVHAGKAFDCVTCKLCKKKFESDDLLKRHLASRCSETTKRTPQCNICGYKAPNNARLQDHYNIHSSENMHECEICGKRMAWLDSLNLHRLLKHSVDGNTFQCPMCKLQCGNKRKYTQHLRTHKDPGFQCAVCNKSFHHASSHRQHRQVHEAGKDFVCEECGKCFRARPGLKTHMMVHSGDRPHSCKRCTSTFRTRKTLQQHEQTHDSCPLICDVCGRQFSQLASLKSHQKSHVQPATVCDTQASVDNVCQPETSGSQGGGEIYTAKKYIDGHGHM